MLVKNTMKQTVVSTTPETTVLQAARLMIKHNIGTLPVVNSQGWLVGVISLNTILDIFTPNYFDHLENLSFVHNFGALEDFLPKDVTEIAGTTLQLVMAKPVSVYEDESIFRAATKLMRHGLVDLPVINQQGELVGLASHVDIGTAFLQNWIEAKGFTP